VCVAVVGNDLLIPPFHSQPFPSSSVTPQQGDVAMMLPESMTTSTTGDEHIATVSAVRDELREPYNPPPPPPAAAAAQVEVNQLHDYPSVSDELDCSYAETDYLDLSWFDDYLV